MCTAGDAHCVDVATVKTMMHQEQSKRRRHSGAKILVMAMALALTWACEMERTPVQPTEASSEVAKQSSEAASRHEVQAVAYRDAGEHLACAETFARSARAETSEERSKRWYEASRCAARAGDYRQSIFHLQAAASSGFNKLTQVLDEPLFRPLHSGSRWLLVVDQITENEKSSPRPPLPLQAPSEEGLNTPCALIQSIKDRITLRS